MDRRRLLLGSAAVAAAAVVFSQQGSQAQPAVAVNTLNSPGGAAIKGYDPVAYFTLGKPTPGRAEHSVVHGGARWQFASAANKALFEADPAKYMPAYGGFCAYGVARGYKVKIEPDAWAIRDGRLYLNYDRSVQANWARGAASYIAEANKKWPALAGAK